MTGILVWDLLLWLGRAYILVAVVVHLLKDAPPFGRIYLTLTSLCTAIFFGWTVFVGFGFANAATPARVLPLWSIAVVLHLAYWALDQQTKRAASLRWENERLRTRLGAGYGADGAGAGLAAQHLEASLKST